METKRPTRVRRDLALLGLVGLPFMALWNWTLSRFWNEEPVVRAIVLAVQIVGTGYFVFLVTGLFRGHRWVWHVLSRGPWNPLGSRRYHEPEVRDYFGITR